MTEFFDRRTILRLIPLGGAILAASVGKAHAAGGACSFSRAGRGGPTLAPTQYAAHIFQQVQAALGVRGLQIYRSEQVANAAAYPQAGTVLYNPGFLNDLLRNHPAAPISVLAHEVGHFSQAGGYAPHAWTRELSADYVSGVAMRRLGYDSNAASIALQSMFDLYGSPSHPDSPSRINAMLSGYRNGQ